MNTNWIQTPEWTAEDADRTRLVYFRKHLCLDGIPARFPLRITADSRYKLYINGKLFQFGPAKGDDKIWFADDLDISPVLRRGENLIAVSVLHYPMDRKKGNHSLFRFGKPRLYAEGVDLEGWRCRIDRSTAFPPEEQRFAPLQIHEIAKPARELIGWAGPDYDDSRWDEAVSCPETELPEPLHADKLAERGRRS